MSKEGQKPWFFMVGQINAALQPIRKQGVTEWDKGGGGVGLRFGGGRKRVGVCRQQGGRIGGVLGWLRGGWKKKEKREKTNTAGSKRGRKPEKKRGVNKGNLKE